MGTTHMCGSLRGEALAVLPPANCCHGYSPSGEVTSPRGGQAVDWKAAASL
jgi:hypothetical protein